MSRQKFRKYVSKITKEKGWKLPHIPVKGEISQAGPSSKTSSRAERQKSRETCPISYKTNEKSCEDEHSP